MNPKVVVYWSCCVPGSGFYLFGECKSRGSLLAMLGTARDLSPEGPLKVTFSYSF